MKATDISKELSKQYLAHFGGIPKASKIDLRHFMLNEYVIDNSYAGTVTDHANEDGATVAPRRRVQSSGVVETINQREAA